jgi:hypothetical protein
MERVAEVADAALAQETLQIRHGQLQGGVIADTLMFTGQYDHIAWPVLVGDAFVRPVGSRRRPNQCAGHRTHCHRIRASLARDPVAVRGEEEFRGFPLAEPTHPRRPPDTSAADLHNELRSHLNRLLRLLRPQPPSA